MLVSRIGQALEPLSAMAEGLVGHEWREVLPFMACFGALFALALPFWRFVVRVDGAKAAVLASCIMSSMHGALAALGGYQQLLQWRSFQVDLPNTRDQALLIQFSLAYMLADFAFLLAFTPGDYVFIAHHVLSSVYLVGCLLTGHGAIGCIFLFFLGEVTGPIFNLFAISKELRHDSKVAARTFALLSPLFTAAFIGMRSVVAPPLVSYFLYSLLFRAQLIPFAWRMPMAASVSLGMVASQLWSYKLLRGWLKRHRRGLRAATKAA